MLPLTEAMKSYIDNKGDMSFAELHRRPEFKDFNVNGKMGMTNDQLNIVYWAGISDDTCNAIKELLANGYKMRPTAILVYYCDGMTLKFPIVQKPPKNGYKELHWLPVVIVKG